MSKRLLLQLTGAQGVGKTSLLRAVSNRLFDLYSHFYIGEVSRNLLADKSVATVDVSATSDTQVLINANLMLQYLKAFATPHQLILAERTAIDCLAYARHLQNPSQSMLRFTEDFVISTTNYRADTEIITLYVPPRIPFVVDGVRNEESQKVIDTEVLSVLREFGVAYETLEVVDFNVRVDFVVQLILDYFNG